MKIRQILFSFKGRSPRKHFWLAGVLPLFIVGVLIGGVLAAQSMIETAKMQQVCRKIVAEGKYTGQTCKLAVTLEAFYKSQIPASDFYSFCLNESNASSNSFDCKQIEEVLSEIHKVAPNLNKAGGAAGNLGVVSTALLVLMSVLILWIALAVNTKRLHDLGYSGWWQAALMVPGMGAEILSGTIFGSLFELINLFFTVGSIVVFGFFKGKPGSNKYGPNPLEK
jgi:uncharacterized membrane protein YhaH (DUF805 family)